MTDARNIEVSLVNRGALNERDVWFMYILAHKNKFYIICKYDMERKKQYFRIGCYQTSHEARNKANTISPLKLSKTKKVGTIDLYRNRTWRVRIKHQRENLHVGYFQTSQEAHDAMLELVNNTEYLDEKVSNLDRKRKLNQERCEGKRRKTGSGTVFAPGKRRWNKEDIDKLLQLRSEYASWTEMAEKLGRTVEACKSRVWRHINKSTQDPDNQYKMGRRKSEQVHNQIKPNDNLQVKYEVPEYHDSFPGDLYEPTLYYPCPSKNEDMIWMPQNPVSFPPHVSQSQGRNSELLPDFRQSTNIFPQGIFQHLAAAAPFPGSFTLGPQFDPPSLTGTKCV